MDACIQAWEDGETAQNIRAGTVAAMVMNTMRQKKQDKVWTWRDFFRDPRPVVMQSAEQIGRAFDALYALVKGNNA